MEGEGPRCSLARPPASNTHTLYGTQNSTGERLGIDIGDKTDVYFGWNMVNDKRTGVLRVGDAVTVVS